MNFITLSDTNNEQISISSQLLNMFSFVSYLILLQTIIVETKSMKSSQVVSQSCLDYLKKATNLMVSTKSAILMETGLLQSSVT